MSYCRWMDSDLYVIGTQDGFRCYCCPLMPYVPARAEIAGVPTGLKEIRDTFSCETHQEMLDHLLKHEEAGHDSGSAIKRLKVEIAEET